MPTSAYNKFNEFKQDIGNGQHDFGTDTLKLALTNTAPTATDANFNVTSHPVPAAANGYPAGGAALTGVTYTETAGTATLDANDVVFTATAGGIGPVRYAVLYNSSSTTPTNAAIAWFDYGSSITIADTETLTVSPTTTIFTIV